MHKIFESAVSLSTTLRTILQRAWPASLDEPLAGVLRAEQIAAVSRLSPMAMTANIVSAALIAWAFWGDARRLFVLGWAALVVAASAYALLQWVRRRSRPRPARASRRAIRRATVFAGIIGLLWSVGPFLLFTTASDAQQLVIASLITGLICGGGFALAAVPQASLLYIGIMVTIGFVSLVRTGEPLFVFVAGLLVVYTAMLAVSVVWHARLLAARLIGEEEVKRQGALIGLLLSDFEENASDWLWETDAAGRLHHVSPRLAEALQRTRDEVRGSSLVGLLGMHRTVEPGEQAGDVDALEQRMTERAAFRDLVVKVRACGETRWWSLTGKPVFDERGAFLGYRGVGTDVTAARVADAKIKHMALHDTLTGLPNRAWFREQTQRVLGQRRADEGLAVLFVNIDRFKGVNEALGHRFGDALLRAVAERLRERMWDSGLVARLGADEFALMQVSQDPVRDAAALAEHVAAAVAEPFDVDGQRAVIGASIGIAVAPTDGTDPDQLLKRADLALHRAKANGGGTYAFFEAEMDRNAQARRRLENDLREALSRGEFEVFYQPLVSTQSGRITTCEALLRWRHPERGMVSPAEFIPLAEEMGLIVPLGAWVLEQACREATRWPDHIKVAVNLSPVQFKAPHLVATVAQTLAASGLRPERLELEITESVLLDQNDATRTALYDLRALGVLTALDDFGTGYSSLSYLSRFPFDKLKIDRCFVAALGQEESGRSIVRAIVAMATSLGLSITAEGVETEEQLHLLRAMGCTDVQGFLFSRPRPADEIRPVLFSDAQPVPRVA